MTGSGGADWRWSDEDLLGPVQLSRANVVFAIVLMVVAAVVILLLRFGDAGAMFHAHPAPRSLPAPTADRIVYVLYPDFPEPLADEIRNAVAADYGIAGSILVVQDGLDPAAYDAGRSQYGAERAIQAMEVTAGSLWTERIVVVGLTSSDLYIESIDWNWAFALRRNGAALVSMARMHRALELDGGAALMRKMVVRQIGFLAFHLPATADPGDLMYRDVLSVHDLVAMSDHL